MCRLYWSATAWCSKNTTILVLYEHRTSYLYEYVHLDTLESWDK